jgi:hypothetical protein
LPKRKKILDIKNMIAEKIEVKIVTKLSQTAGGVAQVVEHLPSK